MYNAVAKYIDTLNVEMIEVIDIYCYRNTHPDLLQSYRIYISEAVVRVGAVHLCPLFVEVVACVKCELLGTELTS